MEFEEWSNKKKEQDNFALWSNQKKTAQSAAASYSAPYYGAGDAARLGVERTQPTQPVKLQPSQPERTTTPASRRGGITLHPGIGEVDQKAKEAAAKERAPAREPQPQVKAPVIPSGQANKLGIEPVPTKPFTFSDGHKAEIPANRFSAFDTTLLPGFEARTGMPFIPPSEGTSFDNPLEATPLGAYTDNWNIEEAAPPVPAVFATMDDETLSQLITEYSDQMRKLKSQGLSGMPEFYMRDNLSEPPKFAKPAMLMEDTYAGTGRSGGTPIFASPQPPEKESNGDLARDFGVGGIDLPTLYDTGDMIGYMAEQYDKDSYLVKGEKLVEFLMKTLAPTFAANDPKLMKVANEMIDRFISGSGDDYENPILTKTVLEHPNTQKFIKETMGIIQEHLNLDGGDLVALKSDEVFKNEMRKIDGPNFNTGPDLFGGLTICLNGTWGYTVDIADYQFDGKNYSGTLRYTLYDHFGLDEFDISQDNWYKGAYPPFAAWYVLQHYEGCEGKYKPFVTYMNFEVPFSGSID